MSSHLTVERLGHVNLYTDDSRAALAAIERVFAAAAFSEWDEPEAASRNALATVGETCLEVFGATSSEGPVGSWVARYGTAWHSLEWTVPDLDEAVATLGERGIRIAARSGSDWAFTHPSDLHGLCLELTSHRTFEGDPRNSAGGVDDPLGVTGPPVVKIASLAPQKAVGDLAELVGMSSYETEYVHLNQVGHGIRFADHSVEFVGSASDASTDLVGTFLVEHGERICALSLGIADFAAARTYLTRADIVFNQFGRGTLMIAPFGTQARVELSATR